MAITSRPLCFAVRGTNGGPPGGRHERRQLPRRARVRPACRLLRSPRDLIYSLVLDGVAAEACALAACTSGTPAFGRAFVPGEICML
jgi:hypothetical protein